MNSDLPFAELQRRSQINAIALQADHASDFSQRIRASLPSAFDTVKQASTI